MITWIKIKVRIKTASDTENIKLISREGFFGGAIWFSLPDKFISHAPDREDQGGLAGIGLDLLPQAPDMDRDSRGIGIELISPDIGQELGFE